MSDRATERCIFEAFLRVRPDFAEESIAEWDQPTKDPPDILCTTIGGRKIGVELGEWLNEEQIREARISEAIENSILKAVGQQPDNRCHNIYFALLQPRPRARVKSSDSAAFQREIFTLVTDVDSRWENEPDWQSPQGSFFEDFTRYPTVGKYLQGITFFPRAQYQGWPPSGRVTMQQWPRGCDWLTFEGPGCAYSSNPMMDALRGILLKKIEKYEAKPPQVSMDTFHLLIHYNQAVLYNTPVETLAFKFEDAARAATEFIGDDPGVFARIFLILAFQPGEKVFRLYPP